MEKRVLIAAVISAAFLALYSHFVLRRFAAEPTRPSASQLVAGNAGKTDVKLFSREDVVQPLGQEDVAHLEAKHVDIEIGKSSGAIRAVTLKTFQDPETARPLLLRGGVPILEVRIGDPGISWQVIGEQRTSIVLRGVGENSSKTLTYRLGEADDTFDVVLEDVGKQAANTATPVLVNSWQKADRLGSRYNALETVVLFAKPNASKGYHRYMGSVKAPKDVPRGTQQYTLSERYFCMVVRPSAAPLGLKRVPGSESSVAVSAEMAADVSNEELRRYGATLYFGPRDYFYLKQSGFEDAFPIGTLGQIGLVLLAMLGWISAVTRNYGLAIIVLSAGVTCAMAPFTLLGFRSMRRMQELKPKVDKIMADRKDDPKRANQEVFALYKEHRVSPLGGCLPMLLQFPVFIALFQAISHYIGLRGQRFLWIADLSLPDRAMHLPVTLPLLGSELNVLPLIMAVVMYFQTKSSQQNMAASGQANMMAGPLMPVLFGVMFYQFPAGLVLYWITNSLMAMFWYRVAK